MVSACQPARRAPALNKERRREGQRLTRRRGRGCGDRQEGPGETGWACLAAVGSEESGRRRLFPVPGEAPAPAGGGALSAMSEPLPAFLDRPWGPWLGTRTLPLRGLGAASPSKVAGPRAPSGQPRFPPGGVTREFPSFGLGAIWSLFQCVTRLINSVILFLHGCGDVRLTPVQP